MIEVLIAIVLLSIVGGAIHEGLRRQQQVFRSIALMVAARSDVRDAAEVLAADLLSASPLDTLPLTADSAVEFSANIGTSISCDSAPGYTIRIPPEHLASKLPLTSLLAIPDTGDAVFIFNDDSAATGEQPRWDRHAIASVSTQAAASACPISTGFTSPEDAFAPAQVITLRSAASGGVRRGAPIRIVRRGRYALYRSSDSRWYLGHRRCNPLGPSRCGTIQPLGGPYAGYSSSAQSGVALTYFDAGAASLAQWHAGARTARIDITVRSRPSMFAPPGRATHSQYLDSASISVALRNRD